MKGAWKKSYPADAMAGKTPAKTTMPTFLCSAEAKLAPSFKNLDKGWWTRPDS
jgi:hypothetical protein